MFLLIKNQKSNQKSKQKRFLRYTRNQNSINGDSDLNLDLMSSDTESRETNYTLNNGLVKKE